MRLPKSYSVFTECMQEMGAPEALCRCGDSYIALGVYSWDGNLPPREIPTNSRLA